MSEVLTEVRGEAAIITLNRPAALNAIDLAMTRKLTAALEGFARDDAVKLVIVRGAGDRAYCAGGDIVALHEDAQNWGTKGAEFWYKEYPLNLYISQYPKPFVPIMHGIILGGGVGVSSHGSHRIVTDDTRLGMPEVSIGFVPDVGGSYLLSRAPGELGRFLGLTGMHVGAAEAIAAGFADTYVPQERLDDLIDALCSSGDVAVIEDFAASPPQEAFAGAVDEINEVFSAGTVEEIISRLEAHPGKWAQDALAKMKKNSPLSMKATVESLRRTASMNLAKALEQEYVVSNNIYRTPEFPEGVRAQVVDKDRNPQWQPATLPEVTQQMVDALFEPLTDPRIRPLILEEGE